MGIIVGLSVFPFINDISLLFKYNSWTYGQLQPKFSNCFGTLPAGIFFDKV